MQERAAGCSESQPFDRLSQLLKQGSARRCRRWVAAFWFSHPQMSFKNNNDDNKINPSVSKLCSKDTPSVPLKQSKKVDACETLPVSAAATEDAAGGGCRQTCPSPRSRPSPRCQEEVAEERRSCRGTMWASPRSTDAAGAGRCLRELKSVRERLVPSRCGSRVPVWKGSASCPPTPESRQRSKRGGLKYPPLHQTAPHVWPPPA